MSGLPRVELADGYAVPRMITGAWQLSAGHARVPIEREAIFATFATLVENGFTAFDCADIYTGVEDLLGDFLRTMPADVRDTVQIHTKLVPDRDDLASVDRAYVERIVDRSLARLGVERLDLVQFSWWDYAVPGYVEMAGWLSDLQAAGKVRLIGVTNFDVPRVREIVEGGVRVVSNQVQYSPLDARPEGGMVDLCREHDIELLCYGGLAGGFLSSPWLDAPEPPENPANRSLVKYALIIDDFGGWDLYQDLLRALDDVAKKHDTAISTVALRWLLDRPQVGAAIVGVSRTDHIRQNLDAFALCLDDEDRRRIGAVLERRTGPAGDVFGLERIAGGRHAEIMRYNLNRQG